MPHTITLDDATYNALTAIFAPSTVATPPSTVTPPATAPSDPSFAAPADVAGRTHITTEMKWAMTGTFGSVVALSDANAWVIGFTVGTDVVGSMSFAEHGGPITPRNFALIRNRDGVLLTRGAGTNPAIRFGPPARLDPRIPLEAGVRYTLTIWNAVAGVSSPMVGQLYL